MKILLRQIIEENNKIEKLENESLIKRIDIFEKENQEMIKKIPNVEVEHRSPSTWSVLTGKSTLTNPHTTLQTKKNGLMKIVYDNDENLLVRFLNPWSKTLTLTLKAKLHNKLMILLAERHEIWEAIETNRITKLNNKKAEPKFFDGVFVHRNGINYYIQGTHMSANVLNREAEFLTRFKDTEAAKLLKYYRTQYGEYKAIKHYIGIDLFGDITPNQADINEKIIYDFEYKRRQNKPKEKRNKILNNFDYHTVYIIPKN